jgi:MFS superfamily sulfate permease-like transporter
MTHVVAMVAIGIALALVIACGIQIDKSSRRIAEFEEINARQQRRIDALERELEEMKQKK